MNFFLVAGYFLDGFATAAEQLAGRAIGARHAPAFARAVRLTSIWGFALAGSHERCVSALRGAIVAIVTTAADVRAAAARYLPWAAFTAVSGVLAFQMDGVFIGATWSRDMRNMMLLSFAALRRWRCYLLTPLVRQSRPVGGAAHLPDRARPQPAVDHAKAGEARAFAV